MSDRSTGFKGEKLPSDAQPTCPTTSNPVVNSNRRLNEIDKDTWRRSAAGKRITTTSFWLRQFRVKAAVF